MAVHGGDPRRLTWHPWSDEVVGWMPDGGEIIFRSRREHPHRSPELFTVDVAGGDASKVPLGWAARLDVDAESGLWAFNRRSRERRTWKRYRGGTATDIWVGHPAREDYRQVTRFIGMDAFPMWHGGRIYFLSDQGGTGNLWSCESDGSDRRRHTKHESWDVRFPAMAPDGRIAYMLAGEIRIFDPRDDSTRELVIDLPSDRTRTRNRYPDAADHVSWLDLSPDGERVALTARGEVFSVPVEEGVTLPVTRGSGARESWASFDHDGKKILFVSDANREEAIHAVDAWGRGEAKVLKRAGRNGWHFPPVASPDGEWIAFADQTHALHVMPARGGTPTEIDRSEQAEIRHYAWSPDGRWLAYDTEPRTGFGSIHVYDTKRDVTRAVTGPTTNDWGAAWDPDGRYLYFLSSRTMNPVIGGRDFEVIEIKSTKPYAVLLREDVEDPFAARAGLPPEDESNEDEEEEDDEETQPVEIDWDGLSDRVVAFPVDAGLYSGLAATASNVFYLEGQVLGMADQPGWSDDEEPTTTLVAFDLEEKEASPFLKGVVAYDLENEAEKMAVRMGGGGIHVIGVDSAPEEDLSDSEVSLGDVVIELDPLDEWEQIYFEAWRHMRDFHWDAGMAGIDWQAVRDQYATLLPRLATRDDLRDLMGELIGELATSHTYVWGGDRPVSVSRVGTGLLGADLTRVDDAYRVERIYRGDAADGEHSPLIAPGVGVKEGDYVLAVNRRPFESGMPVHASFQGLADKDVVLTVNSRPSTTGARDVVVRTLSSESDLRYSDWVRRNRERVAAETDGRMGYIHVPDMGTSGMIEFNTWFYPQLDKEGLVVDVRWNGGGFVSQLMVERLRRKLVSFDRSRGGAVYTYPWRVLNGPFVVLTNQFAGSDGDIFPRAIQLEGLAPVIGMRSWGGVVGIRADKRMVDGGWLTQPEYAWWDPVDGWGLENHGVDPDIEVENMPQELAHGKDAQLARGIRELLRLHRVNPPLQPDFGPADDKTREAFRDELHGRSARRR